MQEIKNKIFHTLLENRHKNCAVLWSGGALSGLVWYLSYKELDIKLPVFLIDDGSFAPNFYSFVISTKRKYKIDLQIVQVDTNKTQEKMLEIQNAYDVVYTGKACEYGTCIVPEGQETWNLIKMLRIPYFRSK